MSVPRFALFAHPGPLADAALERLLRNGYPPCAIIMRDEPVPPSLPVRIAHAGPPTLVELAAAHGLALIRLPRPDAPDALDALQRLHADVHLVSCFPQRIPAAVSRLAALGSFNLHPSLLPRYRGPEPLFWHFRAADPAFGCTLHAMTGRLDCGPILAQAALSLPADTDHAAASRALGSRGAELFADLLPALRRGHVTCTPQDEARASYFPFPAAADFAVPLDWSARRAFQFMHATAGFGQAYPVVVAGKQLRLARGLGWDDAPMPVALARSGTTVRIRFASGVLEAELDANSEQLTRS